MACYQDFAWGIKDGSLIIVVQPSWMDKFRLLRSFSCVPSKWAFPLRLFFISQSLIRGRLATAGCRQKRSSIVASLLLVVSVNGLVVRCRALTKKIHVDWWISRQAIGTRRSKAAGIIMEWCNAEVDLGYVVEWSAMISLWNDWTTVRWRSWIDTKRRRRGAN